jgi:hypothetical protein
MSATTPDVASAPTEHAGRRLAVTAERHTAQETVDTEREEAVA